MSIKRYAPINIQHSEPNQPCRGMGKRASFACAWNAKYAPRYPWETSWAWAVSVRRIEP